jgi:phosphopantetheine adenylyltransferase
MYAFTLTPTQPEGSPYTTRRNVTRLNARHTTRQVYAVIGVNESKTYAVSGKDRKALLERMLVETGLSGKVEVVTCSEYIWQFGKRMGAKVILKPDGPLD